MNRRVAAVVGLAAASSLLLTGCDGDVVDAIETGLASEGITVPALPEGGEGGGDEGQAAAPAETQPAEPVEPQQPEQPQEPVETEQAPAETPAQTPATDDTTATSNVPWWGWALIILAALTLLWLVIASARRRRGSDTSALAAQADGQLAWVRSNVDDPLVRWRADQLRLPAEQRDTDSELARRWDLVDQRVTAATNDLLTIESGKASDSVRQAATLLRQAAEGFRASVDGLAGAVSTGDQTRIATASQGLTADTTVLDQARQRFRQAARL